MSDYDYGFIALDPDKNEVGINVITTIVKIPRRGGAPAEKPGRVELVTDDGEAVNALGNGKYEIVASGIILTSDDPDRYEPESEN